MQRLRFLSGLLWSRHFQFRPARGDGEMLSVNKNEWLEGQLGLALLLSHFSRVWLLATAWTAAHQAPPPMRFSGKSTGVGLSLPLRKTSSPIQLNVCWCYSGEWHHGCQVSHWFYIHMYLFYLVLQILFGFLFVCLFFNKSKICCNPASSK